MSKWNYTGISDAVEWRYFIQAREEEREELSRERPIERHEIPQRSSVSGWMSSEREAATIEGTVMPYEIESGIPVPPKFHHLHKRGELADVLDKLEVGQSTLVEFEGGRESTARALAQSAVNTLRRTQPKKLFVTRKFGPPKAGIRIFRVSGHIE